MKKLTPYSFGINELSEKAFAFYSGCTFSFFVDENGYYIADNTSGVGACYIGSNNYEVSEYIEDCFEEDIEHI